MSKSFKIMASLAFFVALNLGVVVCFSSECSASEKTKEITTKDTGPSPEMRSLLLKKMPSAEGHVKLVSKTMHFFALTTKEKCAKTLYQNSSKMTQEQNSIDSMDAQFASLFQAGIDLTPLDKMKPQLTAKPVLDKNGVLVIKGKYPSKKNKVAFDFKYIYEEADWKPLSYLVNID